MPKKIIRLGHSFLTESTHRSANALQSGARAGIRTHSDAVVAQSGADVVDEAGVVVGDQMRDVVEDWSAIRRGDVPSDLRHEVSAVRVCDAGHLNASTRRVERRIANNTVGLTEIVSASTVSVR